MNATDQPALAERLRKRILEFPRHGGEAGSWVRGVLSPLIREHPEEGGWCTRCVSAIACAPGGGPVYLPYPCPSIRIAANAVDFYPWQDAHTALEALIEDVTVGGGARPLTALRRPAQDETGWFAFELVYATGTHSVWIPGLELDQLRPGPGARTARLRRVQVGQASLSWPAAVKQLLKEPM